MAYKGPFDQAYADAFAKTYTDANQKGEKDGYAAGYNASYPTARKTAYDMAYAKYFAAGESEGLPVRYDEGVAKGKSAGEAKGLSEGSSAAYAQGFAEGDLSGYEANIVQERANEYKKGQDDTNARYANGSVIQAQEAKLIDANADGIFLPGEAVALQLKLRNFGSLATNVGKLTVKLIDQGGHLNLPTSEAILKRLPGDTEAVYINALRGAIIGVQQNSKMRLKVMVSEESRDVGSFDLEYEVGSYLAVTGWNRLTVGQPGSLWLGRVSIHNNSTLPTESGMQIKIMSRDPRLKISQDWINMVAISADGTANVEFFLTCKERGDFSANIFDLQIRDSKQKIIYNSSFKVPVASN
jgi:hypothetical protein